MHIFESLLFLNKLFITLIVDLLQRLIVKTKTYGLNNLLAKLNVKNPRAKICIKNRVYVYN